MKGSIQFHLTHSDTPQLWSGLAVPAKQVLPSKKQVSGNKLNLDLENWHQKQKIAFFWQLSIKMPYNRNQKSFEDVHLNAKIYSISLDSLWNSKTAIMQPYAYVA